MIIAFTGHRPNKLPKNYMIFHEPDSLIYKTYKLLEQLPNKDDPLTIISGGALGVDQMVILISSFSLYFKTPPNLIIAEPFYKFWNKWPVDVQSKYLKTLRPLAKQLVNVSPNLDCEKAPYYEIVKALQKRNEWMVDNADEVWAYWDGSKGGTANCVKYAEKVGKPVRNLFTCL